MTQRSSKIANSSKGKAREKSNDNQEQENKFRKACERCRGSKAKCEKSEKQDKCVRCIRSGSECVFSLEDRKPPPTRAKIEELEALCSKLQSRCSLLESRLKAADPNVDFEQLYESETQSEGIPDMIPKEEYEDEESNEDQILELQSDTSFNDTNSNEDITGLVNSFQPQMTLLTDKADEQEQSHFFGKSSILQIVHLSNQPAFTHRVQAGIYSGAFREAHWGDLSEDGSLQSFANPQQMLKYWPNPKLQEKLISTFFEVTHAWLPFLDERETRRILSNPHQGMTRDRMAFAFALFAGATHFMEMSNSNTKVEPIIALGNRWISLSRVLLLDGNDSGSLLRLQATMLALPYLCGSITVSHIGYPLIASLSKLLISTGAHLKASSSYIQKKPGLEEAHKRLWWSLYVLDRETSCATGRPLCIRDDEFSLDYPIGAPSSFTFQIQLSQIDGQILQAFYEPDEKGVPRNAESNKRDLKVLKEIDAALESWWQSYQPELKSNLATTGGTAPYLFLWTKGHATRVLLHRAFISGPRAAAQLSPSSLDILNQEAHEILASIKFIVSKGIEVKCGLPLIAHVFNCGMILLREAWKKRLRNAEHSFDEVKFCLDFLHRQERRYNLAARLSDLLSLLLQAASQPISSAFKPPAKRRNSEDQGPDNPNSNSRQAPNFNQSGLDWSEIFKTITASAMASAATTPAASGFGGSEQPPQSSFPNSDPFASEELGTLLLQSELNQAGALVDGVTQDDLLRYVLNPSMAQDAFASFFPLGSSVQAGSGGGNSNQFSSGSSSSSTIPAFTSAPSLANQNQTGGMHRVDSSGNPTGGDLNMNDWLKWNDENLGLD